MQCTRLLNLTRFTAWSCGDGAQPRASDFRQKQKRGADFSAPVVKSRTSSYGAVTVSLTLAVWVGAQAFPTTMIVVDFSAAALLTASFSVLVDVAGLGLNVAVTPGGTETTLSATLELKVFSGLMVRVLVSLLPWATEITVGKSSQRKVRFHRHELYRCGMRQGSSCAGDGYGFRLKIRRAAYRQRRCPGGSRRVGLNVAVTPAGNAPALRVTF